MTAAQAKQLAEHEKKINKIPADILGEKGFDEYVKDQIEAETAQLKTDVQTAQEAAEAAQSTANTAKQTADENAGKLDGVETTVSDLIDSKIETAQDTLTESIGEVQSALNEYKTTNDAAVKKAQTDATQGITDAATAQAKADEVEGKIGDLDGSEDVAAFVTKKVGDLNTSLSTLTTRVTNVETALTWSELTE